MVSTRGNRENNESDSKFNLPTRECRKPTTMQEPEDEIFWESDDTTPQAKARKKSIVTFVSRPKRLISSVNHRRNIIHSDEMMGIDEDTDSDDDLFASRKTRFAISSKSRESRRKKAARKEFVMNGDDEMSDKSDCELAPRRSSRQRKFTLYSESWLVGDKKFKGYPSMIHNSEPETEEGRSSRRSHKYRRDLSSKEQSPVNLRRSQRYKSKIETINKKKGRFPINLRKLASQAIRNSKNKSYHVGFEPSEDDEEEEEEEEDEDREDYEEEGDDEGNGENKEDKENEAKDESDSNLRKTRSTSNKDSSKKPGRPKKSNDANYAADTENTDDDIFRRSYIRRTSRNLRNLVRSHTEMNSYSNRRLSESECDDKMEDHDQSTESNKIETSKPGKHSRKIIHRDEIMRVASECDSMHLKDIPKRIRKPVSRFSYDTISQKRHKPQSYSDEENPSQVDDDESEEDNRVRKYSLRKNRNNSMKEKSHRNRDIEKFLKSPARKRVYNKKKVAHSRASSSSSSSSDEKDFNKRKAKALHKARSQCLPMNLKADDLLSGIRDRTKVGGSLADIDPMTIDRSVGFSSIGGLSHHIRSLKEMIIFPFMYPEIFQKFRVSPPRGVLFYGPPGTGKTLVARALANECSQEDKKIAFFMRKGADCLSKWVGESERQLRLLFDQAYQMRPSIIFFDEIDGLAPVRSSRQDQIHSSIVSTLLALMDGLDSREEIVVIGATNRIDAIDPALRRPGRFDREFHFPLPSLKARHQILSIHTQNWEPPLSKEIIGTLAERTVGYCGADLKSLCAEATLCALRKNYPQIYKSKQKLLLDPSKIEIKFVHFRQSLTSIVPAGQRSVSSPGRKLNKTILPLIKSQLDSVVAILKEIFPHGFFRALKCKNVYRPRLLLAGRNGQGHTSHLAPAIIHMMEKISVKKLDLPSLHSVSALQPEEACAQIVNEARRSTPSILFIPMIDRWWFSTSESVKVTLLTLLNELESSKPLLLLATSETPYAQLEPEIQMLFNEYRNELFSMTNPQKEERQEFFRPIFYVEMLRKPKVCLKKKRIIETLPLAPPPEPRKLTEEELGKLEYVEEASLRELRIFLRQICAKLAKNKMFYLFTKPVDIEEVPDYCDIISTPMDLETMMTKIDGHYYECAEDFLKDVDLICSNALEYNPDKSPEDKLIRHKACTLRDTAYAYIKAEMDTDFEDKCREIRKQRKKRKHSRSLPQSLAPLLKELVQSRPQQSSIHPIQDLNTTIESEEQPQQSSSAEPQNASTSNDVPNKTSTESSKKRKHRRSGTWARGQVPKKKRLSVDKSKLDETKEEVEQNTESNLQANDANNAEHPVSPSSNPNKNGLESESALPNGELSTEDSRESAPINSADGSYSVPLPAESSPQSRLARSSSQSITENEDSIVSSSEQEGTGLAIESKNEVIIDRTHLDAVFTSCISATEGCTIEQLHHLYTQLLSLTNRFNSSLQRNQLLYEAETEIRRFAQYQDNH